MQCAARFSTLTSSVIRGVGRSFVGICALSMVSAFAAKAFRNLSALEVKRLGSVRPGDGHIAKARGMTEIAKTTGIKREALYKALRPNAQPRLDTIARVCKALGVKLTIAV